MIEMPATESLSKNERRLLFSFLLFVLAMPVFTTFTNTFLWRGSHDPVQLAVYNMGMYAGVPVGFLLAAALLKRWKYKRLFFVGSVLQGVVPLAITVFRPSTLGMVGLLGVLFGVPMGLYWANRNLLTLRATEGRFRLAFLSIESAQNTAAGIVAPLLIGLYLAAHEATIGQAYVGLMAAGFAMLFVAGALVATTDVDPKFQPIKSLTVLRPSIVWKNQRLFEFLSGMMTVSESMLSLLVILTLLGMEGSVGTTRSGVAALAAFAMVVVGKKIPERLYGRVLLLSFVLVGGSSALFAYGFNAATAIPFFAAVGIVASFRTVVSMSVMFRTVDAEVARMNGNRFLYLFDRESFLNFGRIVALGLFIVAVTLAPTATLRYGLVVTALLHVPLWMIMKRLQRKEKPALVRLGDGS